MTDFFASFFAVDGRIGRGRYWTAGLIQLVLGLVVTLGVLAGGDLGLGLGAVGGLVVAWIGVSATVRRWHDRDRSAWWTLVAAIPVIGPLWVAIELGFLAGSSGRNRFGPPPDVGTGPADADEAGIDFDDVVARWKASAGSRPETSSPHPAVAPEPHRPATLAPGPRPVRFGRRGLG